MQAIGKYRWVVVALLFFATSINYIDRQVIGLLKPVLEKQFLWDEKTFGYINSIFQFFYEPRATPPVPSGLIQNPPACLLETGCRYRSAAGDIDRFRV